MENNGQELSGAYKFDNLAQRGIEISKKYFATLLEHLTERNLETKNSRKIGCSNINVYILFLCVWEF